jgi:hypothetical protein
MQTRRYLPYQGTILEDVKNSQLLFVVLSRTHLFFFSRAHTVNIIRY